MSAQQPSEEELREAMKQLRVEDVLVQTVVTLVNVAGRRLTIEEEKDLDQAGTAIDAVRALMPLCPQEGLEPVRDALAQLQMVFAREAGQPGAQGTGATEGGQGTEGQPPGRPTQEEAERAKARSKIWTPPGS